MDAKSKSFFAIKVTVLNILLIFALISGAFAEGMERKNASIFDRLFQHFSETSETETPKNIKPKSLDLLESNPLVEEKTSGNGLKYTEAEIVLVDKITGKNYEILLEAGKALEHQDLTIILQYCWSALGAKDHRALLSVNERRSWVFSEHPSLTTFQDSKYELLLKACKGDIY